jgi:hypothetical protein
MGLARNALAGKNWLRRGTGLPVFSSGSIPMFTAKAQKTINAPVVGIAEPQCSVVVRIKHDRVLISSFPVLNADGGLALIYLANRLFPTNGESWTWY